MKKSLIIICLVLIMVTSLALAGCTDVTGTRTDNFERLMTIMANSPIAYKIDTTIIAGELESSSTVKIARQNDAFIAEYTYVDQEYATFDGSNIPAEQIITTQGTVYYSDDQVGTLVGETIVWQTGDTFEALTPSALAISQELFENKLIPVAVGTVITLEGDVLDDQIATLFSVDATDVEGITGLHLTVVANVQYSRVTSIAVTYTKNDVEVAITVTFDYTAQEVVIPD
ncbi:MAG: hypothetical protein PHW00_03115 [Clostridia bacterium]|nr:hypothetical protein [Clostridia bacterium]